MLPRPFRWRRRPPTCRGPGIESILLVEDEPAVRALASLELRDLGYTVFEASSGEEALEWAGRQNGRGFDLLLTDVVMPQMSGRELADRIRTGHPGTKVLFISGYTADEIGQHGVFEPGISLLQKPFTASVLAAKVRDVLDDPARRRAPQLRISPASHSHRRRTSRLMAA